MAYEVPGLLVTLESASTALAQFRGVTFGANGLTVPASTNDTDVIGITQTSAATTSTQEAMTVMVGRGISKLEFAGSTLAKGDTFTFSTAGLGVAATTATSYGFIVDGSSGSTGRVLTVLFTGYSNP